MSLQSFHRVVIAPAYQVLSAVPTAIVTPVGCCKGQTVSFLRSSNTGSKPWFLVGISARCSTTKGLLKMPS